MPVPANIILLKNIKISKKMSEERFYIPINLDIEKLEEKYQEEFKKNGIRIPQLLFILDSLVQSRILNRDEMEEKEIEFTPLCTTLLDAVVHNYSNYIQFLLAAQILISDGQYIKGEKCRGFAYNNPYNGKALMEIKIEDYKLSKALKREKAKYKIELKEKNKKYHFITKHWDSNKLDIDYFGAYQWIERNAQKEILENEFGINKTKNKSSARIVDTAEDRKLMLRRIKDNNYSYGFAGEGNRFYSPITNLKRELRNFLTYDGKSLVEIDIKNSQPLLSLVLFNPSFWIDRLLDFGKKIKLKYLLGDVYKDIKNNVKYNNIIMLLKTDINQYSKEFQLYKSLVLSGKFYEYIQEHFEPLYPERFDTLNKVKIEVLRIMFSNPNRHSLSFYKPCITFKKHFPIVYYLFSFINSVKDNYLPIILQKIESYLVIDNICKKINELYPHIPLFTVHDSIITTKENEAIVADIMRSEIYKRMGYEPQVKTKGLLPSNVESVQGGNKKIVNTCTGELFDSIEEITAVHNIKYETLISYLNVKEIASSCWKYAA